MIRVTVECDHCSRQLGELTEYDLKDERVHNDPIGGYDSIDEAREAGWEVGPRYMCLCPTCVKFEADANNNQYRQDPRMR